MPGLGKKIQGERNLSSKNRIIRLSAGSNNCESTLRRKPELMWWMREPETQIINRQDCMKRSTIKMEEICFEKLGCITFQYIVEILVEILTR